MTDQEKISAIVQGHATRGDIYNPDEGEEFGKAEIALHVLKECGGHRQNRRHDTNMETSCMVVDEQMGSLAILGRMALGRV